MENELEYAAREAVLGLQLSFDKSVRFVMRNANVNKNTAVEAVKKLMYELV